MNHASLQKSAELLRTPEFAAFADTIRAAVAVNNRVNFIGTNAAGRLAIRLERAWQKATVELMEKYPQVAPALEERKGYFRHIHFAGEYAVIDVPECLSQSNTFGRGMMRAHGVASANRDVAICLDPTGNTSVTLGAAHYALIHLAPMYMLTCVAPDAEENGRTKEVYTHPNCRVLTVADLFVMELMCAVAAEAALWDLLENAGVSNAFPGYEWFADRLEALQIPSVARVGNMLLADDYLLNALCFAADQPLFQAKNPNRETAQAWAHCFLREPRCLSWPADFYQSLGFSNAQIAALPDLSANALLQIPIGKESLQNPEGLNLDVLVQKCDLPQTFMDIFQNITADLMLNSLIS